VGPHRCDHLLGQIRPRPRNRGRASHLKERASQRKCRREKPVARTSCPRRDFCLDDGVNASATQCGQPPRDWERRRCMRLEERIARHVLSHTCEAVQQKPGRYPLKYGMCKRHTSQRNQERCKSLPPSETSYFGPLKRDAPSTGKKSHPPHLSWDKQTVAHPVRAQEGASYLELGQIPPPLLALSWRRAVRVVPCTILGRPEGARLAGVVLLARRTTGIERPRS
jgi:hypothetical protein